MDLFWQLLTLGYRDYDDDETTRGAAQSADSIGKHPLVGLVVGILHSTIPAKGRAPPISKRRQIVQMALDVLAGKHIKEWDTKLPIGRLLVGDFNMTKDVAEAATQNVSDCPDRQKYVVMELLRVSTDGG